MFYKLIDWAIKLVGISVKKEIVGTREEELEKIVKTSIQKQDIQNFEWALEELERKATAREVLDIIGDISQNYHLEDGMLSLLEMTDEKIPKREIDKIVNRYLNNICKTGSLVKITRGASQATCRKLFNNLFKKGDACAVEVFLLLNESKDEGKKKEFFERCKKTGDITLIYYAKKTLFKKMELTKKEANEILKYVLIGENYLWQVNDLIKDSFGRKITQKEIDCYIKARIIRVESITDVDDLWVSAEKGCSVKANKKTMEDLAVYTVRKLALFCKDKRSLDDIIRLVDNNNLFQRFPNLRNDEATNIFVDESVRLLLNDRYAVDMALKMLELLRVKYLPTKTVDEIIRRLVKSGLSYSNFDFEHIASMGASIDVIDKLAIKGKIRSSVAKKMGISTDVQKKIRGKKLHSGCSNPREFNCEHILDAEEIHQIGKNMEIAA